MSLKTGALIARLKRSQPPRKGLGGNEKKLKVVAAPRSYIFTYIQDKKILSLSLSSSYPIGLAQEFLGIEPILINREE
jgi:hypothetical protein